MQFGLEASLSPSTVHTPWSTRLCNSPFCEKLRAMLPANLRNSQCPGYQSDPQLRPREATARVENSVISAICDSHIFPIIPCFATIPGRIPVTRLASSATRPDPLPRTHIANYGPGAPSFLDCRVGIVIVVQAGRPHHNLSIEASLSCTSALRRRQVELL